MSDFREREHPLLGQRLPDWLGSVPIDAIKPKLIPVSEGKTIPSGVLISALTAEVGTTIGSISIIPELAEAFAQFTENPAWKNLPTEPTSVKRVDEETWEVHVGDFRGIFGRQDLEQRLKEVLHRSPENQDIP